MFKNFLERPEIGFTDSIFASFSLTIEKFSFGSVKTTKNAQNTMLSSPFEVVQKDFSKVHKKLRRPIAGTVLSKLSNEPTHKSL